jgi:hypothetical protein
MMALGVLGWVLAALMVGLWLGERTSRLYLQNIQFYGQPNPLQTATAWSDETPEDRVEKTIDQIEDVMGTRVTRSGPGVDGKVEYDEDTIENGVEYLLSEAREHGEQLSREAATEEVERMLAAEGPNME